MKKQPNRLPKGGRIDRGKAFSIKFDGSNIEAYPGDTLASAFLANGKKIVGRSFKYHRPRGIMSAGVEEPNALVNLRKKGRAEPNTRATVIEVYEGLEAESQNCWPTLALDFGVLNNFFSRFLPAGFYYKTFMGSGPGTSGWMFWEKYIRRAAGMGRPVSELDPDSYEKINSYADVLVIGSGPAGLCAALAAGRSGARVILAEQDFLNGGTILNEPCNGEHAEWLTLILKELTSLKNVLLLTRSTVFSAYQKGVYGILERVWDHVAEPPPYQPRQRFHLLRAKTTILASGAIEQPLVFENNDLPGVMLANSTRVYLHRYGILTGKKVVVATNNWSAFVTAHDLALVGARVSLVYSGSKINSDVKKLLDASGVETFIGYSVIRARGLRSLKEVDIALTQDKPHSSFPKMITIQVDLLAISGGWAPNLNLWSQLGYKPIFNQSRGAFFPDVDNLENFSCVGLVSPTFRNKNPSEAWFSAGVKAANFCGHKNNPGTVFPIPASPFSTTLGAGLIRGLGIGIHSNKEGKAFVDFQHDTTIGDIDLADLEGMRSVEHTKRYTTSGMATDQGKTSNINTLARMAELQGGKISDIGITTFRPPYTPISFGAMAAERRGKKFAPTRVSPIHDWHVKIGAKFIAVGPWQRPWFYPAKDEGLKEAYIREAEHIRKHVGLVDVSTLGKISVQGPDASEFLNRVYANNFKRLKVGRIRYGVMLREDGLVLDDGTTARLGEFDYFMSTTTANAGSVLSHLEFLLQTSWPNLKVHLTSVTDQWAAIAVAGPKSRQLLQEVTIGCDLRSEALPNMALTETKIGEIPIRLHRMSFSGELAYEIYVGSGWGQIIWDKLIQKGKSFKLIPYGTEAMGTLRIEKGHVSAPELDGRNTLCNLGLERLANKNKQYVGSVLRQRPLLNDQSQQILVGLEVIQKNQQLKPGMLLFSENTPTAGHGEGFVSSVTWSPALNKFIGLGFLIRGNDRLGEKIQSVDFLENKNFSLRVVSPHFFDPQGERQNG
ncbi:MAG: 2Fe-2S iron-sulfur cluster-binding protein [Pseudomonadota bacterium]|nr:2Fe-2S iron-sulfur cluster-binding protein [Pseudomonadota bacterium]